MTSTNRAMRIRIILTGVMLTLYLLVLAVQARAYDMNDGRSILQNEHTSYFAYNRTELSPEAKQSLDKLVQNIKSRGNINIEGVIVVGFSDRVGSPSYNEELSRKRAEAVKDYLVSKGIVNARVADMRWFGDSFPATNCPENLSRKDLIACLRQDRRVEVEFDYSLRLARAQ